MNKAHDLRRPNGLRSPSNNRTSHPQANLRFAQGSDGTRANFRLARGPSTPQVAFRLARGASAPPQRVSASLEAPPSTHGALPTPPDRGINYPAMLIPNTARELCSGTMRPDRRCCTFPGVV
jgi:hypothetical protein